MRRAVTRAAMPAVAVVVALGVLALLLAPLTLAAGPKRLSSPVTDDAGVLPAGAASQIQTAFDGVQSGSGVQPWVWYVDTTAGTDPAQFATETARASGLGGADVLLVVAMSDRAYGYWKGDAVGLSDGDLALILSRTLPQNLRANRPDQAALDFADELGAALTATPKPTVAPVVTAGPVATAPPAPTPAPTPADSTLPTLLAIGAVLAGFGLILRYLATHREATGNAATAGAGARDDLAGMRDKDLDALANSLLLQTDDAVRDSEQELGFAQAQFGDDAAAPFAAALDGARADLNGAFALRQQLDDSTPEAPAQRRQMLEQLVRGCRAAQQKLDAQTARFEELRALQQRAPGIIEALPAQSDALAARVSAARGTIAHLQTYADPEWQAVAPNVEEAAKRIAAVNAAVEAGRTAVAASDAPKAAAAAQAGQDALAQGARFVDAIDALAKQLDAAASTVETQLAAAEHDIVGARAAAASAEADPGWGAQVSQAEQLLADARVALNPPKPHVTEALAQARRAEQVAEDVLAKVRSAQEAEARAAAQLDATIRTAQASVTRAGGLVATRRAGVGAEARTRFAEAQRHLDQALALAPSDRAGAIREADAASRLAAEAESLASEDYNRWDDPWQGGGPGGGGGGGGRQGGHDELAGVIIGGIIGGILSGGGRRGGPFGGGGFGGGGFGGFGGGWGGGGFGGGGFGGGGFGGGGGGGSSGSGRW